jgi:hypothetical protein
MIKIKENVEILKSIFKVVENINDEVSLTFKKDKIFIRVVHPSNHCLIVINILKDLFEEYEVKDEITYTLKIDLLNKILKKMGKKEISITTGIDGMTINNTNEKFVLNYYVGVEDDRPLPDVKSTSKWKIKSDIFFKEMEELLEFSSICKLYGQDNIMISTKAHMINGDVNMIDVEKIECQNEIGYYDISYINNIKDIKSIFKDVIIGYGNDQPLLINGNDKNISFEFMLAGREEGDTQDE